MLLVFKSPVDRTRKKRDFQLQFDLSKKNKTNKTELDLCSPCKYASFTTILKKNGQELHVLQPKRYTTIKSDLHDNL